MSADLLQTIMVAVVTNGGVLALFIFVFQKSFERALDHRAKVFEREMDLRHKQAFHQFSKTYDQQSEALSQTYEKLIELNDSVAYLVLHNSLFAIHPELANQYRKPDDGDPKAWERYLQQNLSARPEEAKANELAKAASDALKAFRKKRIYFPEETAHEVERLLGLFTYLGSQFQNVNLKNPESTVDVVAPEVFESWNKAVNACEHLVPKLEAMFRTHLGSAQ